MKAPQIKNLQEITPIKAKIVRDPAGVCRIFCQRAKRKWWFELGKHQDTDTAFERALQAGSVVWPEGITDTAKLF